MKTTDQILKIKATVLYILGQMLQGMDYIHLFKILYFAQQKHLVTYGMPLMETHSAPASMARCPHQTIMYSRLSVQSTAHTSMSKSQRTGVVEAGCAEGNVERRYPRLQWIFLIRFFK